MDVGRNDMFIVYKVFDKMCVEFCSIAEKKLIGMMMERVVAVEDAYQASARRKMKSLVAEW